MDKCREEFEALVVSGAILPNLFTNCVMYANRVKMVSDFYGNGIYRNTELQNAYNAFCLAWKSSRENMKAIELPDQADYFSSECDNDGNEILGFDIESYSSDFIDAITSAGYKVEE